MKYGIRPEYRARTAPPAYTDQRLDSDAHQAAVYAKAMQLYVQNKLDTVVDVGCGNGLKLLPFLARGSKIIGIDYGVNLEYCQEKYPEELWLRYNLENEVILLPEETLHNAMMICADVVEHLVYPTALLQSWRNIMTHAPWGIVSTPDREVFGKAPLGPPWNPSHVREWTKREFCDWLEMEGFHIHSAFYSQSHKNRPESMETITVILRGRL